jgi:hypothetical protein
VEAWVNATSLSNSVGGWCAAVAKEHQNSNNDVSYALYAAQGSGTTPAGHILVGNGDFGTNGGAKLTLSAWTFLATTYDGTTLRTYINGTLAASTTVGGSIFTTTDPLRIGGDWSGEMFTGSIDNVRIYNTPLTQTQIQTDMSTPLSGGASGAMTRPLGTSLSGPGTPVASPSLAVVASQAQAAPSPPTLATANGFAASSGPAPIPLAVLVDEVFSSTDGASLGTAADRVLQPVTATDPPGVLFSPLIDPMEPAGTSRPDPSGWHHRPGW